MPPSPDPFRRTPDAGLLELAERIRDLERSNEDLARLAAVASHDLAEPLRTVSGFLELLARRHADALAGEGMDLVGHAQASVARMRDRIEALLALARVDSAPLQRMAVELDPLVDVVLTDLRGQIDATGTTIARSPLGAVLGDGTLLGHLLQNLLSNAMKFGRPGVAPRIELGATEATTPSGRPGVTFWVQDGGIGIPPSEAERIFESFARLHPDEEYAGSGIGLAICRRIVMRHGGRIWVEPAEGGGSRFCVTLRAV